MDVYIYGAALYCADCAHDIMSDLEPPAYEPWDSSEYPVGPYPDGGGEADCPQHCDRCEEFLGNPLTGDGYDYLEEVLTSALLDHYGHISTWASFYGVNVISKERKEVK